ncbi:hypothetical protein, partial [Enterobacter sp. JH587]|uniref:hypothetical protein n=1 Tax=Enterobacter sp. JH587 TaxID=2962891 RepID=UPI00227B29D1
ILFPALSILILSPEYFLPVREFSSDYHATLDGKNAFQAIQQILNQPSIKPQAVQVEPWTKDSTLKLRNLSICYGEKEL